jgi:hypothetical protein
VEARPRRSLSSRRTAGWASAMAEGGRARGQRTQSGGDRDLRSPAHSEQKDRPVVFRPVAAPHERYRHRAGNTRPESRAAATPRGQHQMDDIPDGEHGHRPPRPTHPMPLQDPAHAGHAVVTRVREDTGGDRDERQPERQLGQEGPLARKKLLPTSADPERNRT